LLLNTCLPAAKPSFVENFFCVDDRRMKDSSLLHPEGWVDQYGDILFRFAFQRVGDASVAEDLVQETFLAAMRTKDRFQGQSSEKTWLFAILKHKIIDHFRSKKYKQSDVNIEDYAETTDEFFGENGKWRIQPSNWDIHPGEAYEQKEFMGAFYQCLSGMPQRLADAFVYREIDGLSTEEICKVLAITPTNCWVILYRARMLLRRCIEINWTQSGS
jgi:RNA polymerase sigma-70 factor, ECF subfamily